MNINYILSVIRTDFFPRHCLLCRKICSDWLCVDCQSLWQPIVTPHCQTCAARVTQNHRFCQRCARHSPAFDAFTAVYRYNAPARTLVLQAKYAANRTALTYMGEMMAAHLPPWQIDAIIPMPMSRWRYWQRGFNQTHFLAAALGQRYHLPILKTVLEKRHRVPQSTLTTTAQRQKNISGAFVAKQNISGRILLVDDVMTSGATLSEAARCLKQAGADWVGASVFAAVTRLSVK